MISQKKFKIFAPYLYERNFLFINTLYEFLTEKYFVLVWLFMVIPLSTPLIGMVCIFQ